MSSSAIAGIQSIEIKLSEETEVKEKTYNVNLYFAELESKTQGERVFNIKIQGEKVMENFDILSEAGQKNKEVVKSFSGIQASNTMKIELEPLKGYTILSGIELTLEE